MKGCPVCYYVENGGYPRLGRACDDCKSNDNLMHEWERLRWNVRWVWSSSFSVASFVLMLCMIALLLDKERLTVHDGGLCLGVFIAGLVIEFRYLRRMVRGYGEFGKNKMSERMFVIKVRGGDG